MKRIPLAGTGAFAVTATLMLLAISGPASLGAAKAKPDCPDKAICLWDEENYLGQRVVVKTRKLSDKVFHEMNDLTSSVFMSRKEGVAVLYTDAAGGGESVCLYGDNRWRINKLGSPFDDSISSTRIRKNVPSSCTL